MEGQTKERWERLCEQAAKEEDPAKFEELIREIDRLLIDKAKRLGIRKPATIEQRDKVSGDKS